MTWQQFVMRLGTLDPDAVEAVLLRHGAQSVTLTDAGEDPVLEPAPGTTPLFASTRISGLFETGVDVDALQDDLVRTLSLDELPECSVESIADRPWEREWLRDFGPMRFGHRLWVCPANADADDPDAVVVRLDPGLAFGTGTHATTALCLEWLDGLQLSDRTLLDYGAGSGILAIAALKLGCRRADALDIDAQAVTAARQNAERNGVGDRLVATLDPATLKGEYDVVVANILAAPLVELAPAIAGSVAAGGLLALCGILANQADDVRAAYDAWIEFGVTATREQAGQEWVRLSGVRVRDRH